MGIIVAPATEYGEVCAQADAPGQWDAGRQAIVVVSCADVGKVLPFAGQSVVADAYLRAEVPAVLRVAECELFAQVQVAYGAQMVADRSVHVGHVYVMVEGIGRVTAPCKLLLLAEAG